MTSVVLLIEQYQKRQLLFIAFSVEFHTSTVKLHRFW